MTTELEQVLLRIDERLSAIERVLASAPPSQSSGAQAPSSPAQNSQGPGPHRGGEDGPDRFHEKRVVDTIVKCVDERLEQRLQAINDIAIRLGLEAPDSAT